MCYGKNKADCNREGCNACTCGLCTEYKEREDWHDAVLHISFGECAYLPRPNIVAFREKTCIAFQRSRSCVTV